MDMVEKGADGGRHVGERRFVVRAKRLTETLQEVGDEGVERSVCFSQIFYFSDGVDDGRVVFSTKTLAYLWQ